MSEAIATEAFSQLHVSQREFPGTTLVQSPLWSGCTPSRSQVGPMGSVQCLHSREHTHLARKGWGRLWLHAAMIRRNRRGVSCSEKLSRILACGSRIQTASTSRALSEGFGVVGWTHKQGGIHSAEWRSLFSSFTATQSCFSRLPVDFVVCLLPLLLHWLRDKTCFCFHKDFLLK